MLLELAFLAFVFVALWISLMRRSDKIQKDATRESAVTVDPSHWQLHVPFILREIAFPGEMQLTVSPLSGGLTNLLWFAESPRPGLNNLTKVLVRVFGKGTSAFINRDQERQIVTALSQVGFIPQVVGFFANGRVERWLEGRTLELAELRIEAVSRQVASLLRRMHDLQLPGVDRRPALWDTAATWLLMAQRVTFDRSDPKASQLKHLQLKERMEPELAWLRATLERFKSPIVFTHGDLIHRNMMVIPPAGEGSNWEVSFIDFEYSCYNYRGFDIGNFFCEYAGIPMDYSRYPSVVEQEFFLREYLLAGGDEATSAAIASLRAEVNAYSLASNLFWGFWAVLQSETSTIGFDYLDYAQSRFDRYFQHKREIFNM